MGVLALFLLLYASFGLMFVFGAPWVSTSNKVARAMLKFAAAKKGDVLLDLGCGNGAISILAAKEFGTESIGFDIHPGLIWWARLRAVFYGVAMKTTFRRANILKTTLPKADIITIYLLEALMDELRPLLVRDLDPLTHIVSHGFKFSGIEPLKGIKIDEAHVYLYQVNQLFEQ